MADYMKYVRFFSFILVTTLWASGSAQTLPQFNIVKPGTTGVPCDEVRVMGFDPAGNLWIAGRWVYLGEAAVAMLEPSDNRQFYGTGPEEVIRSQKIRGDSQQNPITNQLLNK